MLIDAGIALVKLKLMYLIVLCAGGIQLMKIFIVKVNHLDLKSRNCVGAKYRSEYPIKI